MISVTLWHFASDFKNFTLEIQNASTSHSKANQLRNVKTVRWVSRNITTQPGEIGGRKSGVIAFVVNNDMKIIANNFYILSKKVTHNILVYRQVQIIVAVTCVLYLIYVIEYKE